MLASSSWKFIIYHLFLTLLLLAFSFLLKLPFVNHPASLSSRPSSICCRIPQHLWMYAYTSVYITYREEEEEEEARKRKYAAAGRPLLGYTVWWLSGSPLNDGSSLGHHRVERSSARIVRPSVSCSLLLLTLFGDRHSTHSPARAQHIYTIGKEYRWQSGTIDNLFSTLLLFAARSSHIRRERELT